MIRDQYGFQTKAQLLFPLL